MTIRMIPGTNYFGKFSTAVRINLTNELGYATFADCIGNPNTVALEPNVYNTGCFMVRVDILSGANVYINIGTVLSPSWTLISTSSGSGTVTNIATSAPLTGGPITTTGTIGITQATTSTDGYLSSTDWNTFNGKGSGTVTSVAALTLGTTGTDLSSTVANRTTTPVITLNVPTASATNRGVLSPTDWTTFNNKGSGNGTVTSVATDSTLTGGPINTTGTLGLNLNNSNTWTAIQNFNGGITGANIIFGFTSTVSAAGTTVLTSTSNRLQQLTGSTTQTFQLPNANSPLLPNGTIYEFNNNSTGLLTIKANDTTTVISTVPAGGYGLVLLTDNSTTNGTWDKHFIAPSNISWGTNSLTIPNGTQTSNNPNILLTQTFNAAGVNMYMQDFNLTNTASATNSGYINFRLAGSQKAYFDPNGGYTVVGSGNITVNGAGNLVVNGGQIQSTGAGYINAQGSAAAGQIRVTAASATVIGYTWKPAASQTANAFDFQDSSGTAQTSFGPRAAGNNVTLTKYNGTATTGYGLPAIYSSARLTGQTAAASLTAFTVGAADGSFNVSANVLVTTSTTHNFTVTCSYTDEGNTSRTLTFAFFNLAGSLLPNIINTGGAVPYQSPELHIRCKASTTITIASTGTFTSVTYNIEGCIKQIA